MKIPLLLIWWVLCILGVLLFCAGCVELDPQTKAQVRQVQQKNAVDLAKEKADAALKNQKATDNPTAHPFIAMSQAVAKTRDWMIALAGPLAILTGIAFGLQFWMLTKTIAHGCFCGLMGGTVADGLGALFLQFVPLVVAIALAVALGLLVVEEVRAKGNQRKVWADIKKMFGMRAGTALQPLIMDVKASTPAK